MAYTQELIVKLLQTFIKTDEAKAQGDLQIISQQEFD